MFLSTITELTIRFAQSIQTVMESIGQVQVDVEVQGTVVQDLSNFNPPLIAFYNVLTFDDTAQGLYGAK